MEEKIYNNMFEKLNNEIRKSCKDEDELLKNIPFIDEHMNESYKKIYTTSSIMPMGSMIGNFIDSNIFKKINKNSKNLSNVNIENNEWNKLLKNNTIENLMNNIKFNDFSINLYLNNIRNYKNLTLKEIAIKSNFKYKNIEKFFAGDKSKSKRTPSRDCIIGLCFTFDLNLVEANYLLKAAGFNELYLRNKKDLIVCKCLLEKYDIHKLNDYITKYIGHEFKIGNLDEDECY